MRLIFSPSAIADFERVLQFLSAVDAQAAISAGAAIDEAIGKLMDFPQRGRPSGVAGIRELIVPFGQAAYVLRYAYASERDTLVVLRVWHGREERR